MNYINNSLKITISKACFYLLLFLALTQTLYAETQEHIFNFANIKVSQTTSGIALEVTKLEPSKDPEIFNLANPARLVIDFYTAIKTKTQIVKSNLSSINAIRIGQHLDKIRVVFDLQLKSFSFTKDYNATAGTLTVVLNSESASPTQASVVAPSVPASVTATPTPTKVTASATPSSAPSVSNTPAQTSPTVIVTAVPSQTVESVASGQKDSNSTLRDIKDQNPKGTTEQVSAYTFKEGKISVVDVPRSGNVSLGSVKKQEQAKAEQILDQLEPDTEEEIALENSGTQAEANEQATVGQDTASKNEASVGKQVLDLDKIIDSIENDNSEKKKLENVKQEVSAPTIETPVSVSDTTAPEEIAEIELNQEVPPEIEKLKPTLWEWIFGGLAILFGVIFVVALILSRNRKS